VYLDLNNINFEKDKSIQLTEKQKDVLKELGNIGSGNAITALSDLLKKKIEMSLTSIDIIPFWKIPHLFGDVTKEVFGIYSKVIGENDFRILQIYTKESIINMINNLTEFDKKSIKKIKDLNDLDDFSVSIISEIGNILVGHYTSALANLLSISIIPSVPDLALDTIGALTSCAIAKFSKKLDFTLIIETTLKIEEMELDGILCFIPSIETVENLLKIISLKYNM